MLIDMLDDDGYLGGDLEELARLLPAELEIDIEELQIALRHLQNMEPAGIGARSLGESLVLQLMALSADTPFRKEAIHTAKNYLEILAAKDYGKLKKLLHCDDNMLRGIQSLIVSLNPRPGSSLWKSRDALRRTGRDRQEGEGHVARFAQPGRNAEAAHQSHVCRHPCAQPGLELSAARGSAAGSQVADQERTTAIRHHPARISGHCRSAAAFLRARRGSDAPTRSAGNCRDARVCTSRRYPGSRRRSSCSRPAASSN